MTKIARLDNSKSVGCFPDETLMDALSKMMDVDEDGTPTSFRVIGKMQMPGQLERPVAKYHGREVEVQTEKAVLLFRITDS